MTGSEKIIQTAVQALKSKDKNLQKRAIHLLLEAAKNDQRNENILLLLSAVFPHEREKLLKRVLEDINPTSSIARDGLKNPQRSDYFDYIVKKIEKNRYLSNDNANTSQDTHMKTSKSSWQLNYGHLWQGLASLVLILTFSFTITQALFDSSGIIGPITQFTWVQQRIISSFTWSQIFVMLLALLGLMFFKAEAPQKKWPNFAAIFDSIHKWPTLFWFIFALVFIALGGIILLLTGYLIQVVWIWLIAWWLMHVAFHTRANNGKSSGRETLSYLGSLILWYILGLIFYGFAAIFTGSVYETVFVYAILVLLYLGARFGSPTIRGRLADDLFIAIIIITIFEFIRSFYLPEASASTTILGTLISFIASGRIDHSIIAPLLSATIIEYYMVSIFFLILLNTIDDDPQSKPGIPNSLIRFALNAVGIIVVSYATGQAFITFYVYEQDTLLIVRTIINLVVAMTGIWVLILAGDYLPDENMIEETDRSQDDGVKVIGPNSIQIEVPSGKVMETLRHIKKAETWTPGLVSVTCIPEKTDYLEVGSTYNWVYEWQGAGIEGKTEILTIANNTLFEMRTVGRVTGGGWLIKKMFQNKLIRTTWRWELKEQTETTELTLTLHIYLPPQNNLSSFLLTDSIQRQANKTLKSLKSWLETDKPSK